MILKMYAIYDTAAGAFMNPFFLQNNGMAMRAFQDAVNSPESQFYKHPDQYSLFYVGEWNDENGYCEPCNPARRVVNGFEVSQRDNIEVSQQDLAAMDVKIDKLQTTLTNLMSAINIDGEHE